MSGLQVFNFESKNVRTIQKDDNVWFVAKDVCDILGLSDVSMSLSRLKDNEKLIQKLFVSGQNRDVSVINESGLYRLIFTSNKPNAEIFKDWVCGEVLPTIRKTGGYVQKDRAIDFVNSWLPQLDETNRTVIASVLEQNRNLLLQVKEDKPKVNLANAITASTTSILIGDFAKILKQNGVDTGQNRFFDFLRNNGYLIKRKASDFNSPTQKAMDLQLFEIKETTSILPDNCIRINKTTKITGKGQLYFADLFLNPDTKLKKNLTN